MTAALEVAGLSVRYGTTTALTAATLEVGPGRISGLVGLNGSGKSSLLKAVLGTVRADSGDVRILGREPAAARRAGLVGYVPQAEDVDWAFPLHVRDVVLQGRRGRTGLLRRPSAVDLAAIDEALARTGLTELATRQIGALSGGQRKRAFVARCLAQEARLLLLDEPFAGVDARSADQLAAVLRGLAADGASALVSTHDLAALPALAHDVVLLAGGRVVASGPTATTLTPDALARVLGMPAPALTEEAP